MTAMVRFKRMRWMGYEARMVAERTPKQVSIGGITERRRKGRLRFKWSQAKYGNLRKED